MEEEIEHLQTHLRLLEDRLMEVQGAHTITMVAHDAMHDALLQSEKKSEQRSAQVFGLSDGAAASDAHTPSEIRIPDSNALSRQLEKHLNKMHQLEHEVHAKSAEISDLQGRLKRAEETIATGVDSTRIDELEAEIVTLKFEIADREGKMAVFEGDYMRETAQREEFEKQ